MPASPSDLTVPAERPTRVRYSVLAALAFAAASAYLTRYCISVANTTIQADLHLTTEQMGWVFGVFNIGYFVFQVPGGWLGNRFGTRVAIPAISAAWSLVTVWTSAVSSFAPLIASQMVFGCAQAGLVPLAATVINDWFPPHRRGVSSAVVSSAMSIGGVVAMSLTALLLEHFDWRNIFRLYSLVGIVWAAAFYVLFRTHPREHPWTNAAEIELIANEPAAISGREIPGLRESAPAAGHPNAALWRQMLVSRSLWGICLQSFFRAAGYGFFVSWFPAVLEKGFHVSREQAGAYASLPLVAVVIGALSGGLLIDWLLILTGSKWISRTGVAVVAMLVCGLVTLSAAWTGSAGQLVGVTAVGALFSGIGNPSAWAGTMDIAGCYTSMIVGVMNMAGTIGSFALPILLGYMIGDIERTDGDWNVVIYLFGGLYLAAGLAWLLVDPDCPVVR